MKLNFLPPQTIRPEGWLRRQLETQAEGLHGNLDKVWKDIYDSKWLGGNSDGWERFPYFLDGYIPLAFLLGDEEKMARSKKYIEALLTRQNADGVFCPAEGSAYNEDLWAQFLILKVLTVYADCANEQTRMEEPIRRGLKFLDGKFCTDPPYHWAAARWFECLIPALWLYRRKKEDWLISFTYRLKAHGLDYGAAMKLWEEPQDRWTYETHVVNIAMALKSEEIFCELTGERPTGLSGRMLRLLTEKHGTAYGHFTGDECLSGTSPSQGSELCGIVEAMYSYEWLAAITGEAEWGDRLEELAFNGLPAAVSADMWTHQYDQQVNQIACMKFEKPVFRTNGGEANLFGLEPHFGCCTANFGQGWPKFALSAYMVAGESLAVLSPVPARIAFGAGNEIAVSSEYPFRRAFAMRSRKDVKIMLRVPAWATPVCDVPFERGNGWMTFVLPAGRETKICFETQPILKERGEGRYCLKYGALLFALPVEGYYKKLEYTRSGVERKFPYCDYEIMPVGEWRYAFASARFTVHERPYDLPFDRLRPPLTIEAELAPVEWEFEEGHPYVASRRAGTERRGDNVTLSLQPYGATDLRVTEMAFVGKHRENG